MEWVFACYFDFNVLLRNLIYLNKVPGLSPPLFHGRRNCLLTVNVATKPFLFSYTI